MRLDDYRTNPTLPSSLLNAVRSGLDKVRAGGVKVVPRFAYNFGQAPDASLDVVLEHIKQVAPILEEHSDVIAVLHAGFIGAWGEWHGSTNGLTTPANKKAIGEALLAALPDTRMIQVRAPFHRRDIVGAPSSQIEAFGASGQARIGFLNDCFLSSDSDAGTYGGDQTRDRSEAKDFSRYTVTGGETCEIGYGTPRQKCDVALKELAEFHWDYLNADYYVNILNDWRTEGCFDEIERRLGYRIALQSGAATSRVAPGGVLSVDLRARNDGFGKVYNPRPIDLVLRNTASGEVTIMRAAADARPLLPLAGEARTIELSVSLPNDLAPGAYALLLSLPDAASTLAKDVRYSVRLANVGLWDDETGFHDLGLTVQVER